MKRLVSSEEKILKMYTQEVEADTMEEAIDYALNYGEWLDTGNDDIIETEQHAEVME